MCPDVLYSVLSYDVTEEPLWLSVPVWRDPFWSLSLLSDSAEEFFAVDDQSIEGKTLELVILGPGRSLQPDENVRVVASPSESGVAVVRAVLEGADSFMALDRLRKRAKSAPAIKSA
jgi:uncharacterized membrane protein